MACFNEDLDRAQKICEDSQDQAACYHLARRAGEGLGASFVLRFEAGGVLKTGCWIWLVEGFEVLKCFFFFFWGGG